MEAMSAALDTKPEPYSHLDVTGMFPDVGEDEETQFGIALRRILGNTIDPEAMVAPFNSAV